MDLTAVFGTLICLGIFLTYVPQFYKIISKKTSEGISHYFLLIGAVGASCSLLNAFTFYSDIMFECDGFKDCSVQLLGFYQIGIQFFCFGIFYALSVYIFRHIKSIPQSSSYKRREYQLLTVALSVVIVNISITMGLVTGIDCVDDEIPNGSGSQISSPPSPCFVWAKILGYASLTTVFIQYIPLIYEIVRNQSIGSISMVSIGLQVIGNACWTTYLIMDDEAHLTTWLPFLMTTCFQFILMAVCIWFEPPFPYCRKKKIIYSPLLDSDEDCY